MTSKRGRKLHKFDLDAEYQKHVTELKLRIGQTVPLSRSYTVGPLPILVSIEGDTATLRFNNGAQLINVPLRDLVDDANYWRH
jgi:hypothetical protein